MDISSQLSDILAAYFSAIGMTESIVERILAESGGVLCKIAPVQPYTSADLFYNNDDCHANKEQNDPDMRPVINGKIENIGEYNMLFLGYPIWWDGLPKFIYTFLESYKFDRKIIVPFVVSLFGAEEDLYNEFAVMYFRVFLMLCLLNGFQIVAAIYLQAVGKPMKSAAVTLSRQIIFLIPAAILLPKFMGVTGVLWSGPVADGLAFILSLTLIIYEMKKLKQVPALHDQTNQSSEKFLSEGD